MRRSAMAMVVTIALVLVGGASAAKPVMEKDSGFPAGFELTSTTCPNLAPGTVVEGTGTGTSITQTMEKDGVTTIRNVTHINGTAMDQAGNTYVFNYTNSFTVSSSGGLFSGVMVDSFSLAGSGPATLSSGFRAVFTTDFGSVFQLDPLSQRGNPLDFATVATVCDPL